MNAAHPVAPPPPRRALLLRRGGLGDFVLTLPCVALLRRAGAQHITVAGDPRWLPLAPDLAGADAVLDATDAAWMRREADPAFWAAFDRVHAITADDGALAASLAAAGCVATIVPPQPRGGHAAAWFARGLGAPEAPAVAPAADRRGILLHPGSGSPAKNLPLAFWLDVAAALGPGERAALTWLAGEADLALVPGLEDAVRRGLGARVLVAPPIRDLARLLGRTAGFAGHDSGPAHLAAWRGAAVTAVFGPTDPAVWAPLGARVSVERFGVEPREIAARFRGDRAAAG